MKRIERITTHTRGLLPLIIALLFGGVALCHAQAPEKVLRGIRYTRTGEGTCRASMVKDDVYKSYIVNPTVTINGEECRVTSISDMGINAIAGENYDDYRYKYVRYEIKFPEFVDTICAYCFQAYGVNECWDFTIWKELSFPKSRVIESYAFSTCVGDIVIPEGVEELGYKINGECEYGPNILSLPSTLKRMSALAVSRTELTKSPTIWAKTPPEIIPTSDKCVLPINNCDVSRDKKEYENEYVTIYVPEESIEAYKKAPGWCKVPNIIAAKPYSEDINGIRYTVTGVGTCNAQALASSTAATIKIPSSVTLQGQACKVTSISDMTVNKESKKFAEGTYPSENSYTEPTWWTRNSNYPVMTCNYSFPSTVEIIDKKCFYRAEWPNLQLPKNVKEIQDEAFYEFGVGLSDWVTDNTNFYGGYVRKNYSKLVIPDGVESIGFNINYHTDLACLPASLKSISSRAIWYNDNKFDDERNIEIIRDATNTSITCYAKEPPTVSLDPKYGDYMVVNFNTGIDQNPFEDYKRSNVKTYPEWFTVYVPEESVKAYKSAPGWCDIPNILPIGVNKLDEITIYDEISFEVGDGSITVVNGGQPVEVYTIDGRRVAVSTDGSVTGLNAGLYIVRCGATVSKVYVR